MKYHKTTIVFSLLTLIILSAGIALRCHNLSTKSLEYDEIWTLTNYVSKTNAVIFSDLGTPNNHPLNSLLIKYSVMLLGANSVALRLFALISGIGVIIAAGWLAWEIFKKRFAVIITVTLCSFSGGLIHYSQTGRGYMLQTFLLTLLILTIVIYENHKKNLRNSLKLFLLIIIPLASIAAIVTLSPSIIFITAIALIHWYYLINNQYNKDNSPNIKTGLSALFKNNYGLIISYTILYSFALIWYLSNYEKFKAGQQFGIEINSISIMLDYSKQFLPKFNGYLLPFIPLLMFTAKPWRKWAVAYLFIIIFILGSILMLRGGPPRTYLPLIPLINIAAAGAMTMLVKRVTTEVKNYRIINSLMIPVVCLFTVYCSYNLFTTLKSWQPPDWKKIWQATQKEFPESNSFICYPACAGLEVSFNNQPNAIIANYHRRVRNGKFIQVAQPGFISITDKKGSQKNLYVNNTIKPLIKQLAGVNIDIYGLKEVTINSKPDSNIIIAYIAPNNIKIVKDLYRYLANETDTTWGDINIWLTRTMHNQQKQPIKYLILATDDCKLSTKQLLEIEKRSNNIISFFYLTTP